MILLKTLDDTRKLGRALAVDLRRGDCLTLNGPLGAGKTELARSIVRAAAGADIDVPSPTFSLVETYEFDTPLFHIDLYRLDSPDQAVELGLDDMIEQGITLIEWPDRAAAFLPQKRLDITIGQKDGGMRDVQFRTGGDRWADRIESLLSRGVAS